MVKNKNPEWKIMPIFHRKKEREKKINGWHGKSAYKFEIKINEQSDINNNKGKKKNRTHIGYAKISCGK